MGEARRGIKVFVELYAAGLQGSEKLHYSKIAERYIPVIVGIRLFLNPFLYLQYAARHQAQ